jgi:hypothetical protein
MRRETMLVWGTVTIRQKEYFLLDNIPYRPPYMWQKPDTTRWLVANREGHTPERDEQGEYRLIYSASHVVFGTNAVIELLDNPTTHILVDFFSDETEEGS